MQEEKRSLEKTDNNPEPGDITMLLQKAGKGDQLAENELYIKILPQLKRIAQQRMLKERNDHTISSTGLLHEFYLKLMRSRKLTINDRNHFFAIASRKGVGKMSVHGI